MAPLTIALPKGRLAEAGLACLARAGYALPANGDIGRRLVLDSPDGRLRLVMAKPSDVPVFVEYGAADLGIAGLDLSLIHISEPTRLGMISYAVFCLKKKK